MNARPRILIVDDAPENVMVLGQVLEVVYDVQFATSGQEALNLAFQRAPDLVLLDVMMPGMNGMDVLRHLRDHELTRDIPVIMISADASEQTQLEGLDMGADDYLTKPVVTTVLQARVRNLLQRKQAETQLRLAAHVFRYSGEAIMVTDRDNLIVEVNPAFTRLTGYALDEVRGKNPKMLSSGHATPDVYRAMWAALRQDGFWQGEMWDRKKDGSVFPKLLTITVVRTRHGDIEYHIASFTSISEQKAAEERIQHLAHHDTLTGLPNRLLLKGTLEHDLAQARRDGRNLALMFIDLDRFKSINDSLGHPIGDDLLVEVARRLNLCVRESDMVARLGGDEFVVMLSNASADAAAHVARIILQRLGQPYDIQGHTLRTTGSIGISLCPDDCDTYEAIMKNADLALYEAKSQGRNNYQFFKAALNQATHERQRIESRLYSALEDKLFTLNYQPQVSPGDKRIIGLEALLRWQDIELGFVPPDRFIPIAEETGLILPIGQWVLDEACRQLRAWRDAGIKDVRMAVNLSLMQLRQEDITTQIADTLARYRLIGPDLELEITETAAMQNPDATIRTLCNLRELGVDLAVDDFGTGYSSLAYLKLLPIQRIKLDRTFVRDIQTDANDAAICSASIALAHALGLEVVAEGVETETQRAYLQHLDCDVMQGYLFGKPMPASALFK